MVFMSKDRGSKQAWRLGKDLCVPCTGTLGVLSGGSVASLAIKHE
jgi:hypothetical protein